jgi:replicative DNA helicase
MIKMDWIKSFAVIALIMLSACVPNNSAEVFSKPENLSAQRSMQTRTYSTNERTEILAACISVLQDMGYNIDETNSKLGLVSASKLRDTDNKMEKASMIALTILSGQSSTEHIKRLDDKQNIRVSIVVNKLGNKQVTVRATFQRVVLNVAGEINRLETIHDQTLYQGFFAKLSKAIFLEANEL